MAKRTSKSNTKAVKAAAEPTDDQKGSGVKAQTEAGKPASAPQVREVADSPPQAGADPDAVLAAVTSNTAATAEGDQSASTPTADPDQSGPSNQLVTVVGPRKGFRRAGRAFGPEPVTFPMDEITARQLTALEAEPRLRVTITALAPSND